MMQMGQCTGSTDLACVCGPMFRAATAGCEKVSCDVADYTGKLPWTHQSPSIVAKIDNHHRDPRSGCGAMRTILQ